MCNKICVYAICKNESKFVDKWLESMHEADYIVVLDTGSTDGTYELLKADKRVYRVEQKIINPWRFDVARNESMKLIPNDANILISTDLDELFEPGWANIIREKWIDGYHIRGTYKYAWSHTEDGKPDRLFYYNKLHDRNWYWKAPVHEFLETAFYPKEAINKYNLDLSNEGVYLHHYQDKSKVRTSMYTQLLELRDKELPNEIYTKIYLALIYFDQKLYEKSNKYLQIILNAIDYKTVLRDIEIAYVYFLIGRNHRAMGNDDKALYYYNKAIAKDPGFRNPYLYAAEICNEKHLYNLTIGYVEEALKKSYRHYTWIEDTKVWGSMPEVLLTVAYYHSGQVETALRYAEEAIEKTPHDPQCQFNVDIIKKNLMVQRKL